MIWLFFCLGACTPTGMGSSSYPFNDVFPLHVGTSWQYAVTRFDGFNAIDTITASSTITDTVLQFELNQGYWIATIQSEQSVESLVETHGNYPTQDVLQGESKKTYWLIVEGQRIWKQETSLNLGDLQNSGQVELVFPLAVGQKWSMGNIKDSPPYKEVKQKDTMTVPAGQFFNCFSLESTIGGTTFQEWFCPGIGFVWRNSEHHGTPSKFTRELNRYSVK